MRYVFIHERREHWPVRLMCQALQVSPAGFYAWAARPRGAAGADRGAPPVEIRATRAECGGRYGGPRVHAGLPARGHPASLNTVAALMRRHRVRAKTTRRFRHTTDSNHSLPVAENVSGRRPEPDQPNRCRSADITYIPTREGWLYLAVVEGLLEPSGRGPVDGGGGGESVGGRCGADGPGPSVAR